MPDFQEIDNGVVAETGDTLASEGTVPPVDHTDKIGAPLDSNDVDRGDVPVIEGFGLGDHVETNEKASNSVLEEFVKAVKWDDTRLVAKLVDQVMQDDDARQAIDFRYNGIMEMAEYYRAWNVMSWLIRNGCDWNETSDGVTTTLCESLRLAAFIIAYFGVDVVDSEGYTALMRAASKNDMETSHILLNLGADPHVVGDRDQTALDMATDSECRALLAGAMAVRSKK